MRKKVFTKINFKCISPALTPVRIKNLQEFLKTPKIAEEVNLSEILAGERRSQILFVLGKQPWTSVCDLADILSSDISGVSHQLSILRKAALVKTKKRQRMVLYALEEKLPELVETAINL